MCIYNYVYIQSHVTIQYTEYQCYIHSRVRHCVHTCTSMHHDIREEVGQAHVVFVSIPDCPGLRLPIATMLNMSLRLVLMLPRDLAGNLECRKIGIVCEHDIHVQVYCI